jgi:TolA-binding protein
LLLLFIFDIFIPAKNNLENKMRKGVQLIITLGFIYFSCSNTSDKEYMQMASDNVKNGNVSAAITSYQNLLEEYPESELAPDAIVQQATLYHGNKVTNISRQESLRKAAELFASVSEQYPNSKQATQSLFMAGFIYANEIDDYDKAKEVYNTFLNKYPDHELAASAEEELNYMGLSAEEILKRKIAAQETK